MHYHEQPARAASYAQPSVAIHPAVMSCLSAAGRARLFCHQARAVDTLLSGGHVMLATPTASGKSLGYTIPTLHMVSTRPEARCLYLFPTKALAQDQMRALRELTCSGGTSLFGLPIHTYDGDTPQHERAERRRATRVLLTNPDMLHVAVLPNHATEWSHVLRNLTLVVIDEAHMYKGAFGAHVALILRRLRRLCRLHGASPVFACCSATVGNPAELFTQLTGIDTPTVITEDGSPHGRRRLLLWNPPLQAQPAPLPPGKGVPLRAPPGPAKTASGLSLIHI